LWYIKYSIMTTLELKNSLIRKIGEINDKLFLQAIKTILDAKLGGERLILTTEQKDEIRQSKMDLSASQKLLKRFQKELSLLLKHPELGMQTDDGHIRGLIMGDFIIFYEPIDNNIFSYSVWDCRQNPAVIKMK